MEKSSASPFEHTVYFVYGGARIFPTEKGPGIAGGRGPSRGTGTGAGAGAESVGGEQCTGKISVNGKSVGFLVD